MPRAILETQRFASFPAQMESNYNDIYDVHGQATPDRGLAAMMYAPCTVTAQVGDGTKVTLEQSTCYPFDERIELLLSSPKSVAFPLYLRIPAWCAQPKLSINGQPAEIVAKGGELLRIARTWSSGDKVVWELPMAIAVRQWEKNRTTAPYGPGGSR